MSETTFRSAGRKFFPDAIFESIVGKAEKTGQTVAEICEADRSMPSAQTAYTAIWADPDLARRYSEAMRLKKLSEGAV